MKIAYFTDVLSQHGYSWISHFADKHEVMLICEQEPGKAEWYANDPRIDVRPILPTLYPLRAWNQRSKAIVMLKELLHKERVDIIHSMYAHPYAYWGWHLRFPRHIVTTRGSDVLVDYRKRREQARSLRQKGAYYLLDRLTEKALRHARFITCTSQRQYEVVEEITGDPSKISLVRTGVDAAAFLAQLAAAPQEPARDTIIFSNRALNALYNIHLIAEAFALLKKRLPQLPLKLLTVDYNTNAQYKKELEQTIQRLALDDSFIIAPAADPRTLASYYKNAAIVVMAPSSDGTPVSGIEAMLAQKPLLCPPLRYDRELFSESTCKTFASYSAERIAEALEKLLLLPENEKRNMTAAAHAAALQHADFPREMEKIEALYQAIMR